MTTLDLIRLKIAPAIRLRGGRAYYVGGYVRDFVLGIASKDFDIEVHGLEMNELQTLLQRFGKVDLVGRSFGVLKLKGHNADFSLPRNDIKVAAGHQGFEVTFDPHMGFTEAARRRDFTINSMSIDIEKNHLLDPFGGRKDLALRILRETDADHFSEDPLRAMRAAQFIARYEMTSQASLVDLCMEMDLSELPGERLKLEMDKLLLKARLPSRGLRWLRAMGLIRFFPELEAMIECPQQTEWHPEGDVWTHVIMVVDEAAKIRDTMDNDDEKLKLMYGALCHDLGKPETTTREDGRWKTKGHEAHTAPTKSFMKRLAASNELTDAVVGLVESHMKPSTYWEQQSSDKAYRRLARRLGKKGINADLLEKVARADHHGRKTVDAKEPYVAGTEFLARAKELEIQFEAPSDVVLGRHLIAHGMKPGPEFGPFLKKCRDIQDETGSENPDEILNLAILKL